MTHKEKADQMVNEYRMILMNEDTECGNEILCTSIAVKCALVAVNEILNVGFMDTNDLYENWHQVKKELETYGE